jgi:hypothetical protein
MKETEMGYRGSKSSLLNTTSKCVSKGVKEQRVDGSWYWPLKNKGQHLRCTLMGFERNYQVKILSKQLNNISFSSYSTQCKIDPWFITGF